MRTRPIIIGGEFREDPPQVILVEHDQMIDTFAPDRPDKAKAITRSIAHQARTIRIPVHMMEAISKVVRTSRQLLSEIGREPTPEELAEKLGMPLEKVQKDMALRSLLLRIWRANRSRCRIVDQRVGWRRSIAICNLARGGVSHRPALEGLGEPSATSVGSAPRTIVPLTIPPATPSLPLRISNR